MKNDFDHWLWFQSCVRDLKLPPSEAWHLDQVELFKLFDIAKNSGSNIDISEMLNFERIANGADREWIQNGY